MKEKLLEKFGKNSSDYLFEEKPELPANLNIEVTSACNHKCIFCCYHSDLAEEKVRSKFMDEELLEKLIIEASRSNIGRKELGFHMTGEPLLFKNLEKYIKLAKEHGFEYIFMTTNGSLATKERIKSLIESGLDSIRYSINGATKETYSLAHGIDDFDNVVANLKSLCEYKIKNNANISTSISCVLTQKNIHEKELMKELFEKYVDELIFIPVLNIDRFFPQLSDWQIREITEFEYIPCKSPFTSMYVSCEGNVVPCCAAIKEESMVMGNINNDSLTNIWNNNKFVNIRRDFINHKIPFEFCNKCILINKKTDIILN